MALRVHSGPPTVRLAAAAVVGLAAIGVFGSQVGWTYAPVAGWIAAALVYLCWTWLLIAPMTPAETREHATAAARDDSTPRAVELIVVLAALASLAGVGALLVAARHGGDVRNVTVGILSVICAWLTVHTAFTLRYARLYYPNREIDFNDPEFEPTYLDFAYVAFTVGMTYQVADTNLRSPRMRRTILAQALVSFVLGAVILAISINLVASLLNLG
ncbi:DUF1345 domain-containing protein [Mycolicibacterium brumae]|uniref:DUF1345 domain-containing protein n=1 Tax=Mycolicibacterium brumae TaxID=85968 RepID=A0A2G5PGV3_9MYCO|nr:DUF1345 domain-containing protein [Mycolicibacterium brumae]MCV7192457.1 DUF1345 domain-containing protein [Mycolicibacterium brumae]PIB77536.1 DUF1345 domain-containing protein [Mycolicibacterium brumae]RWA18550.1 hypothetical protein MBRU_04845 [Mycolicibacterium brumae DSM 44177]UWW10225.1 DUF1345 domain-containing protein [Mycolicibacterium brumae]